MRASSAPQAAVVSVSLLTAVALAAGCARVPAAAPSPLAWWEATAAPRHDRVWKVEQSQMPFAQMDPEGAQIRHVRQARWRTERDREIRYADWHIRWDDVVGVDFVVVPFQQIPLLAHTMLSFRLRDGRALALSVEARLESDESYAAVAGAARQFELIYILADEPDLFGLRAVARGDDIYLYQSRATPKQAAELLRVALRRANQLKRQPEFYDSLVNNCTTNLIDLLGEVGDFSPEALDLGRIPGQSTGRWAYDMGLLASDAPFPQLRRRAWVSGPIRQYQHHPDFSRRIRRRADSGPRDAGEVRQIQAVSWDAS